MTRRAGEEEITRCQFDSEYCAISKEFKAFREVDEKKEKEATQEREEYRLIAMETHSMVKNLVITIHGSPEHPNSGLVHEVKVVRLGLYGDQENQIKGLTDIVQCLVDYKIELKLVRFVWKKVLWIVGLATAAYVAIKAKIFFGSS